MDFPYLLFALMLLLFGLSLGHVRRAQHRPRS